MSAVRISVIIPVRNGGSQFERCLRAFQSLETPAHEIFVVDDGSSDGSARLAAAAGMRLLHTEVPGSGPAQARNLAAQHATGEVLFFCDADVEIRPDTLARIRQSFDADPELAALFGSYDAEPSHSGLISQYKNLFHHYVHQHGATDASTFWSGCGAIRRDVFVKHGGFPTHYRLPSIEDIDLGHSLKKSGQRIKLDKTLQVKHLKHWTLRNLLHSDIVARGIPWTRLILRERAFLNDLNLQTHNRASVASVYLGLLCAVLGFWQSNFWLGVILTGSVLLVLNRDLYRFFIQQRGLRFTFGAIGLHWFYYFYNGISFSAGVLLHTTEEIRDWRSGINQRRISNRQSPITSYQLPALAILLLAVFLRFYHLGAKSMWLDELLQIELASRSLPEILDNVIRFGAMPLDYFVTHALLTYGVQDYWLRIPAAFWSTLTVAVLMLFARSLFGRLESLAAGLLLAVAPFHIQYAQEQRPYALFGLLVLLSFFFLLRATKTNHTRHWIGYALATALSLLAHYFTLFAIGAQVLITPLWLVTRRPLRLAHPLLRFGLALLFVLAVLATTPYFDNVFGVGQVFASSLLNPDSLTAEPTLKPNQGTGPVPNLAFFEDKFINLLSGGGAVWRWTFFGLAAVGLLTARPMRKGLLLLIWTVLPAGLTILFLVHRGTFYASRYATPTFLAITFLAGVGLAALGRYSTMFFRGSVRWRALALPLLLILPAGLSLARVQVYYNQPKEDWRRSGEFIAANLRAGDSIVAPLGGSVIAHYVRSPEVNWLDISDPNDLGIVQMRTWIVLHPYVDKLYEPFVLWLQSQTAVVYPVDNQIIVYLVGNTKEESLASVTPPETAPAWLAVGQQNELLNEPTLARAAFEHAIELHTAAPIFHSEYADFLRRQGHTDEAAVEYLIALDRDAAWSPALVGIGRVYLERDLLDDALTALEMAVALDPFGYASNYFLAQAHIRTGQEDAATIHLERAALQVPELIEPP